MSRGVRLKECTVCGAEFAPEHGNKKMCPECTNALQRNKGRGLPREYEAPGDIETYERRIRERYMARYRDTIVAEGYADRQRAKTLAMVGKIRTEL